MLDGQTKRLVGERHSVRRRLSNKRAGQKRTSRALMTTARREEARPRSFCGSWRGGGKLCECYCEFPPGGCWGRRAVRGNETHPRGRARGDAAECTSPDQRGHDAASTERLQSPPTFGEATRFFCPERERASLDVGTLFSSLVEVRDTADCTRCIQWTTSRLVYEKYHVHNDS